MKTGKICLNPIDKSFNLMTKFKPIDTTLNRSTNFSNDRQILHPIDKTLKICRWVQSKGGNLATWRKGVSFSFGLVSPLLQNRFQFRFQFCLCTASVSGFQFRFKFHPRKLFYFEYELFKCSISWHFCFITISCRSDGRVRRAITSEVVDLGIIPSPVKLKTQKLLFTASICDAQH